MVMNKEDYENELNLHIRVNSQLIDTVDIQNNEIINLENTVEIQANEIMDLEDKINILETEIYQLTR